MTPVRQRYRELAVSADPHLAANREILRRQIVDLWSFGEYDVAAEIYGQGVIDHMPLPGQGESMLDLVQVVRDFRAALPDLTIHLTGLIAEGDRAVDYWRLTGTHTGNPIMGIEPSGRGVDFHGIDIVRIQAGKITDIWHVEQLDRMLAQLRGDGP